MEAPLPEPVPKESKRDRPNKGYKGISGKLEERKHVKRCGDEQTKTQPSLGQYTRIVSSGTTMVPRQVVNDSLRFRVNLITRPDSIGFSSQCKSQCPRSGEPRASR